MTTRNSVELCNEIAAAAGVDSTLIALITMLSNKKQLIFRGVRYEEEWVNHLNSGIKANGGDGQASFWTTGFRVFTASNDHFQPYDSTFFHYAPGKKGMSPRMYITATKARNIGVNHSPDSLIMVGRDLSCNEFTRLEVYGSLFGGYESLYPAMIDYLINFCKS